MTAVDGVLDRLEGMVLRARSRADRSGYFAAQYWHFAYAVRRALRDDVFDQPDTIRALLPELAERWFQAQAAWASGAAPPAAWRVPLRAAEREDLTLGQHLLAATNAHLNLDLPTAFAATLRPGELDAHRGDFRRVRALSAGVLAALERESRIARGGLGLANAMLRPVERRLLHGVVEMERERAWTFARDLLRGPADRWRGLASSRDVAVAWVGRLLLRPSWPVRVGLRIRALTQVGDPGRVIDALYLGVDGEGLAQAALAQARSVDAAPPPRPTVPGLASLGTGGGDVVS